MQDVQKAMLNKIVIPNPKAGTTDKAELFVNDRKIESSEYGQKDINKLVTIADRFNHSGDWAANVLLGNPWQ